MRYVVDLGDRQVVVEVEGDRITVDGRACRATLSPIPGTPLRQLMLDGRPRALVVEPLGPGRWALGAGGERREVEVLDERTRHLRSLAAGPGRAQGSGVLAAPMPGLVLRVNVAVGDTIAPGAGLLVLEAMKMENELRAPGGGTVRAVRVAPGQAVEKGQVLVEWE